MDFQSQYEFNPKMDGLGKGSFFKVYKAWDQVLERAVALKFFGTNVSEKNQILNMIKKVIRFEHPNLCKYYDVAVFETQNMMAETDRVEVGIIGYLDGDDFEKFVAQLPEYTDRLLVDILQGLSYLHKKGMVHGNLKPQKVLIKWTEDGPVAKLTHFGLSKLIGSSEVDSSTLIGSVEYMAPEQFNPRKYGVAGKLTTNKDLWSFGLFVYELIERKPLFGSRNSVISVEQVLTDILSDASLAEFDVLPAKSKAVVLVLRCLVKNSADRVQVAAELIPLFLLNGELVSPLQESVADPPFSFGLSTNIEAWPIQNIMPEQVSFAPQKPADDLGHAETLHLTGGWQEIHIADKKVSKVGTVPTWEAFLSNLPAAAGGLQATQQANVEASSDPEDQGTKCYEAISENRAWPWPALGKAAPIALKSNWEKNAVGYEAAQ